MTDTAVGPVTEAHTVVVLSGHAKAGKSELARLIADKHGEDAYVVSFKDAIAGRAAIESRSAADADVLIEIGQSWADTDPVGFCRAVLSSAPGSARLLLVESVHHEIIHSTLSKMIGTAPLVSVFVQTKISDIRRKFAQAGKGQIDVDHILRGRTEIEVEKRLLAIADIFLDGGVDVETNAARVLSQLREPASEYIGGLDTRQRRLVVERVADEFGVLAPSGFAEKLGATDLEVEQLVADRQVLGVDHTGTTMFPVFEAADELMDRPGGRLLAFAENMTDWELLLWLISEHGLLDGKRPIDVPFDIAKDVLFRDLSE